MEPGLAIRVAGAEERARDWGAVSGREDPQRRFVAHDAGEDGRMQLDVRVEHDDAPLATKSASERVAWRGDEQGSLLVPHLDADHDRHLAGERVVYLSEHGRDATKALGAGGHHERELDDVAKDGRRTTMVPLRKRGRDRAVHEVAIDRGGATRLLQNIRRHRDRVRPYRRDGVDRFIERRLREVRRRPGAPARPRPRTGRRTCGARGRWRGRGPPP